MKGKIVCFGESLIRYQPIGYRFFGESSKLLAFPGGSEANVAVKLGQLGIPVSYVSVLPENKISREYVDILHENNVDTSNLIFKGDKIGFYTLLSANGLSSGEVIYDRNNSSFSKIKTKEINWDVIFNDCELFHWTALTPALSQQLANVIKEALEIADSKGIKISVDLNYRNKLWNYGKSPDEVMPELVSFCNVIMGNIWASNKMLGTQIDLNLGRNTSVECFIEFAQKNSEEIFTKYKNAQIISNTFRFMDNPKHNLFFGTIHSKKQKYIESAVSKIYETNEIVDRIGSGDAFMAGLLASIYRKDNLQNSIENATLQGYNKLFTLGDFASF